RAVSSAGQEFLDFPHQGLLIAPPRYVIVARQQDELSPGNVVSEILGFGDRVPAIPTAGQDQSRHADAWQDRAYVDPDIEIRECPSRARTCRIAEICAEP